MSDTEESKINEENTEEKTEEITEEITEEKTEEKTETDNEKKTEDVEKFNPKTKNDKFKVDCWNVEKNGDITPRDVNKKSRRSCWFTCDVCNHDFQRTIRIIYVRNKWCPFCYDGAVCDNDECDVCYNHSFASLGE